MCLNCGYYNGRQVIDLETKRQEREARMQAKREAIKANAGADESEAPVEETKEEKS
jgi:hypothetical protein